MDWHTGSVQILNTSLPPVEDLAGPKDAAELAKLRMIAARNWFAEALLGNSPPHGWSFDAYSITLASCSIDGFWTLTFSSRPCDKGRRSGPIDGHANRQTKCPLDEKGSVATFEWQCRIFLVVPEYCIG